MLGLDEGLNKTPNACVAERDVSEQEAARDGRIVVSLNRRKAVCLCNSDLTESQILDLREMSMRLSSICNQDIVHSWATAVSMHRKFKISVSRSDLWTRSLDF